MSIIDTYIKRLTDFEHKFADIFVERVKIRTPVDTGRLQAGWRSEVKPGEIDILNPVPYCDYVEDGTPKMAGVHMLKVTASEADQIAVEAIKKVT